VAFNPADCSTVRASMVMDTIPQKLPLSSTALLATIPGLPVSSHVEEFITRRPVFMAFSTSALKAGRDREKGFAYHAPLCIGWIDVLKDAVRGYGHIDNAAAVRVDMTSKGGEPLAQKVGRRSHLCLDEGMQPSSLSSERRCLWTENCRPNRDGSATRAFSSIMSWD